MVGATATEVGTDWAAWTTAGATIVTAAILLFTAIFALRGLKDAKKTRHAQLVAELSRRWDEPRVLASVRLFRAYDVAGTVELIRKLWGKDRDSDANRASRDDNLKIWYELSVNPNLIETLGVMCSRRMISLGIVYDLWGASIIAAWEEWAEPVEELRTATATKDVWLFFQNLAAALRWYRDTGPPLTTKQRLFWLIHGYYVPSRPLDHLALLSGRSDD